MLVLPVLMMMLLGCVFLAVVIRDQLRVHEAAREAARAASLDPDSGAAAAAVSRIAPGAEVVVRRSGVGDPVVVSVSRPVTMGIPILRSVLPTPTVRATAVMRAER